MIICCGEALIDFLPVNTAQGAEAFQPFNGGSVYNVAIALGRMGCPVGFFGGLSEDFFGDLLGQGLDASNVDTSLTVKSSRPTTLAFVNFNNGQPEYAFLDEGSAGRMLGIDQLPDVPSKAGPDKVNALHFGSISLIHDPAASTLEKLARREKKQRVISIDPNIRPTLVSDESAYRSRLQRMFGIANIIKISDEDLAWLAPDMPVDAWVGKQLERGCALVVVTKGGDGATAFTRAHTIKQKPESVEVVDTVGAGDTFMAGLLASLEKQHLLTREKLNVLDASALADALAFATRAAAINVSRAGANPPWAGELM